MPVHIIVSGKGSIQAPMNHIVVVDDVRDLYHCLWISRGSDNWWSCYVTYIWRGGGSGQDDDQKEKCFLHFISEDIKSGDDHKVQEC